MTEDNETNQHFLGDRYALLAIVGGKHDTQVRDFQVTKVWNYLRRETTKHVQDGSSDSVHDRLALVMITIDRENPYEIFDRLNSTGLPLEEPDLIRNYIFMQLPLELQEAFNADHWQPFEDMFADTKETPATNLKLPFGNAI